MAKELGANEQAISSEEQWLQQMHDEADDRGMSAAQDMIRFFLKAWSCWPESPTFYMVVSDHYKPKLIQRFFEYAPRLPFDEDMLGELVEKDFEALRTLSLAPRNTKMFLTRMLPVIESVNRDVAARLARLWMEDVRNSGPSKDRLNPPDPFTDYTLAAAGENLMHLQQLAAVIPFNEVEGLMQDVDLRFKEFDRLSRLNNWSAFYLNHLKQLGTKEAFALCVVALDAIPFVKRAYDQRLRTQWQYLQFRLAVEFCLKTMLHNLAGGSDVISTFIGDSVTPEMLESIAGTGYFNKVVEEDDGGGCDQEFYNDLAGERYHALHDDIQIVLSEMFERNLTEDWLANVLDGAGASFGLSYRSELLLRYMNDLASGAVSEGYSDYLVSIEQSGKDRDEELSKWKNPSYKALKGHTAFSFVLSYALKHAVKDPNLISQLQALESTWHRLQLEWVGKK